MTGDAIEAWDQETDLLVVGTGAAGLTAAVVAANEGLKVLVIEKTEFYGGTTAFSGGVAWIPDNHLMKDAGIPDTRQDALTYLKHNIGNRVAPSKLEAFVEHAPVMARYMSDNSAVQFQMMEDFPDYRPETPGGCKGGRSIDPKVFSGRKLKDFDRLRKRPGSLPGGVVGSVKELRRLAFFKSDPKGLLDVWYVIPRNIWNRVAGRQHVSSGRALVARLRYSLQEKNVPLWLNTGLDELITENGAVTGARVTKEGNSLNIRARKGVVIAAGGFDHNKAMRQQYFDKASESWASGAYSSGAPGSMGDGIRAGQAVGAALDLMDDMWWMPSSNEPGALAPTIHVFERGLPHIIIVNSKGKRFANEARPYNELGRVIYEDDAPPAFMVFDNDYRNRYTVGTMLPGMTPERFIRDGYVKKAETLDDLARQCGIDAAGLKETVSRFNAMAEAGRDDDFGKGQSAFDLYAGDKSHKPNPCLGPVAKAPFYAIEIHAGDLGTKGGLLTNERAQVLREDGTVIEGLYAAGNSSACVVGNFYPGGGGTIGAGMTYSYLAAMHAAGRQV
ncbi:FAD-dependent oxidoreductase [Iodidimonas sp. SYSU 1G8]|uniref:FAD-dependent oxidoreductase n=1 Tax=Iodidimonas sp. SYSU 1G8 TaxID=3133967 RepID=UPI0031FEB918